MRLSDYCICGYLISFTAVVTAQQNITVDVLEGDSAILSHVYKSPLTSGSFQTVWNDFPGDSGIKYLGTATCLIETLQCNFAGNDSFECYCNKTHTSLRVKNNVSNEDHGHKCGSIDVQSQTFQYALYVTVPVKRISITNVGKPIVVIAENTEVKLECRSSPSRPNATIKWVHNSIPLDAWSSEGTVIGDLVEVNSILSLTPDRSMNGNNITCSGNNYRDDIKYDWVTLNVTYPPTGLPVIEHLHKNATFPVIENNDSFLNCINNVSNPLAQLDWICGSADFISVTDVNITAKRLQVRASRMKNTVCSCISTYLRNVISKTDVKLDVLYSPTITGMFSNGTNASHIVVFENDTILVSCAAEGNPAPDILWTQQENVTYGQNITIKNVKRSSTHISFTCIAKNVLNDSRGSVYQRNESKVFTVDVLYPPSIIKLHNISLIEGNSTSVDCEIISGNPSAPLLIRWDDKPGTGSVFNINSVHRTDSRWHTCEVNNTMSTTFGEKRFGIDKQSIFLHVLYSPEEINITSTRAPNHGVSDTIRLIENTYIKLFCSAKGNPLPSSYSWSGLNTSDTSEVYVHGSKDKKGNVTCSAKNVMTELPQNRSYNGIESKSLLVDVLYPPEVKLTYRSVIEGEDVNISCVQTAGKISHQSIHWTSHPTNVMNNNFLIIRNVTRKHAGNCTCMVNYTMNPTYGESKSDSIIGVTYLDVFYKAELSNLFVGQYNHNTIVTVNESDSVNMVCILDSNPVSTMEIYFRNKTLSRLLYTKILEHFISRIACIDTGAYICSGYNLLNVNGPSSRTIQVLVNCSPRRSPFAEVKQNVSVSPQGFAAFTFFTLAYPPPRFKWFRIENSVLVDANNGYSKVLSISENEMRIDFALANVSVTDYGEYVLTINNTFGGHQQSFFLLHMVPTRIEEDTAEGISVGVIAGVASGSVIGTLMTVAAVYIIYTRLRGKQQNAPDTSSDLSLSKVYQNELKDDESTYTTEGGISNVYEQLNIAGWSDQQYQELTQVAVIDNKGHRNVYENLDNKSIKDEQHVGVEVELV